MAVGSTNMGGGRLKTTTLPAKNQTVTATTNIVLTTIKPRKFSSISLKDVQITVKNNNPYSAVNATTCQLILREKGGSGVVTIWSDSVNKATKTFTISAVLGRATASKASLHKAVTDNYSGDYHQYVESSINFAKELELVAALQVRFPAQGDYSKIQYGANNIRVCTM